MIGPEHHQPFDESAIGNDAPLQPRQPPLVRSGRRITFSLRATTVYCAEAVVY